MEMAELAARIKDDKVTPFLRTVRSEAELRVEKFRKEGWRTIPAGHGHKLGGITYILGRVLREINYDDDISFGQLENQFPKTYKDVMEELHKANNVFEIKM